MGTRNLVSHFLHR